MKLFALVVVIALVFAGLWVWRFLHSIGISSLKGLATDIRAGVNPIVALDTVTTPLIQRKVAAHKLPPAPTP